MFQISFKISRNNLADTLTRLHQFVDTVSVTCIEFGRQEQKTNGQDHASPLASPTTILAVRKAKPKKKPKKKAAPKKAPAKKPKRKSWGETRELRGGLTAIEAAANVLDSMGSAPFHYLQVRKIVEPMGVDTSVLYQAIKAGMESGLIKRISPGLYQRTPKSFATEIAATQVS